VARSGGAIVTAGEDAIAAAQGSLARMGWFVEPTGAVAAAGALEHGMLGRDGAADVILLTGSGLKGGAQTPALEGRLTKTL
jgi:threonine synthase